MDLTASSHNVMNLNGVESVIKKHFLRYYTSLVLDEIECVYHVIDSNLPVHTDTHETNDCTLQRVVHIEG